MWFKKSGTGKMNCKCKKIILYIQQVVVNTILLKKNHKLLEELILDNTNENDTVIDCCMGSGSTGIVAVQNNRNFIGIELDENYYKIACERINKSIK